MNGIEVAVKFPKTTFVLRSKDLKKYEKEVSIQAKVREFLNTFELNVYHHEV